mgnify:CR=1 FL=1
MERRGDAEEAIEKLNGTEMYERTVRLDWAKSKNPKPSGKGKFLVFLVLLMYHVEKCEGTICLGIVF